MSTYETTMERENEEIEVEVDFDFQPAEKMTHDYPGCDASLEINSVICKCPECSQQMKQFLNDGQDTDGLFEIELTNDEQDHMEEEIMDWISNYDDERWDK